MVNRIDDDDSNDEKEVQLNSELLEKFSNELSPVIQKVIDSYDGDPRFELLVAAGLIAIQASLDSELTKNEFLNLMSDLMDDVIDSPDEEEDEMELTFLPPKKGNQFSIN